MKHLLIGGSGYLGSVLADTLAAKGETNITIVDRVLPRSTSGFPKFIEADFTGDFAESFKSLLREQDHIYLLGAIVGRLSDVDFSTLFRTNYEALVRIATTAGIRPIIHVFSTASLFEGYSSVVAAEDTMPRPIGPYAHLKWAFENFAIRYVPNRMIYRIASCYGWSPAFNQSTLVNKLLAGCLSGEVQQIGSPLNKRVSVSDVSDVASFVAERALNWNSPLLVHLSSRTLFIQELIDELSELPGSLLKIESLGAASHGNEYLISNAAARASYNFPPGNSLVDHYNALRREYDK